MEPSANACSAVEKAQWRAKRHGKNLRRSSRRYLSWPGLRTTKALAQGLMKQGAPRADITKHLGRARGIKQQVDQLSKARQELGANIQKAERSSLVLSGREEALRSALASL